MLKSSYDTNFPFCLDTWTNITSSLVDWLPSTFGLAFLANFGAVIFDKQSCLSGGGPPLGWPRIITESPDKTFEIRR